MTDDIPSPPAPLRLLTVRAIVREPEAYDAENQIDFALASSAAIVDWSVTSSAVCWADTLERVDELAEGEVDLDVVAAGEREAELAQLKALCYSEGIASDDDSGPLILAFNSEEDRSVGINYHAWLEPASGHEIVVEGTLSAMIDLRLALEAMCKAFPRRAGDLSTGAQLAAYTLMDAALIKADTLDQQRAAQAATAEGSAT